MVKHKTAPNLIYELFQETKHPYNLWNNHTFRIYNAKTVQYGIGVLLLTEPKILSLYHSNINNSETLETFKEKISYWKPDNSPCRLFKTLDI